MVSIDAHILKKLTTLIPSVKVNDHHWSHLNHLCLADPEYYQPRQVDIIIGADHYGDVIRPDIIRGDPSLPIAQQYIFGWIVLGPIHVTKLPSSCVHHLKVGKDDALQELLTKFWVQEETPMVDHPTLTQEEEECEAHFRATHSRDSTGRYVVRIPLKCSPMVLGRSQWTASRCLKGIIRRLNKDVQLKQLYFNFMKEYEELGHMRRVSDADSEPMDNLARDVSASGGLRVLGEASANCSSAHHPYYLPHHGILKLDSSTTKLRVVFNGSSPTSSGKSANDIMHTGPNLLLNVMDVLIWVRHHCHIFTTDITKMYRQIRVHKEDWNLQRILWVDEQLNELPFYLTTVTYGTTAAPFLATRVLLQLVEDAGESFPLAVPSFTHGRYVDDIFGGADTLEQLKAVAQDVIGLCNAGGFPLAKWHATDEGLFTGISDVQSLLTSASSADGGRNIVSSPSSTVSLDDCETKLLGLKWTPQEDKFIFSSKFSSPPAKLTKRLVLSEVAQIFDPLGFVSPVVIKAKVLLQEL